MPLIKKLIEKGILSKEKAAPLEFEAKESGKKEEDVILESGLVPESVLFDLKSEILKIPLKIIDPEQIPLETLELIPEETAKYYQMVPFSKTDKVLEIGMVYPEDLKAQEALKFLARQGGVNYKVFLITPTNFRSVVKQYRTLRREVSIALKELETELEEEKTKIVAGEFGKLEKLAEEAPVTKIVAVILRHAVEGSASDIHIEPVRDKLRVRFRLLGELHASIFLPLKVHSAIVARIKIISNLKIDETRIPQDGRFSAKINDKTIDFRVSSFPTVLGEKVAIRVLDPSTGLKSFEDLGLEGRNLKAVKEGASKPYGLILVTGPTGSGKSTTLYAILQLLNKETANIVTLEDPVEYFMEGINQSQVRPEIGYDFPVGLRHILRQDPNIIMVGEIRDGATANLVTNAALTGHIVLSTLHTTNTLGVIPRLIDLGVETYLIPSTLRMALAQRLVRKLCDKCKKETDLKPEMRKLIIKKIQDLPEDIKKELIKKEILKDSGKGKDVEISKSFAVFKPVGCKQCGDIGFSGRIALFEALSMTQELAQLTLKKPIESEILAEANRQGMVSMEQDGILKVLSGITTIEEVLRVVKEQ